MAAAGASLLLRLGGRRHRVAGSPGCEVTRCPAPVPLPDAPPWLAGIAVHKGEVLPLVDLAAALGGSVATTSAAQARVLVTRDAGCVMAFLVDDVDADDGRPEAQDLDLRALGRELLARAGAAAMR